MNLVLKSQDVVAFTAAVARVEEGGHSFQVSGDQQVAKCTVRITVDPADLKRRLAEYAGDAGLRDRMRSQQQRIMELEGKIVSLSEALRGAGPDQAVAVRRERSGAFLDFRAVEAALASWGEREERLQRLKRLTQQYVKVGMTREEVRAILGPPDRTNLYNYHSYWRYGPDAKVLTITFDTLGKDNGLYGDGYVWNISGADKK